MCLVYFMTIPTTVYHTDFPQIRYRVYLLNLNHIHIFFFSKTKFSIFFSKSSIGMYYFNFPVIIFFFLSSLLSVIGTQFFYFMILMTYVYSVSPIRISYLKSFVSIMNSLILFLILKIQVLCTLSLFYSISSALSWKQVIWKF